MNKKDDFKWIDSRSAVSLLAAVGLFFFACFAVEELNKEEATRLAAMESAQQQAVVQTVDPMPESIKAVVEPEIEVVPKVETVTLWDVPLDTELQLYIVQLCEEHHIEPSVVIAMVEKESTYQASVIGDGGEAFGLMQIWIKWHKDRMDKHGVTDLLDPFQNVTVGVDYLAEMLAKGNGLEWALAAYNKGANGANAGYGFDYATDVLTIKENLEGKVIAYELDR